MAIVGYLEFEAHVIPLYWVGSPWGLFTAKPVVLVVLANALIQGLIELRQRRRSGIQA